jgi:hypothetical protein
MATVEQAFGTIAEVAAQQIDQQAKVRHIRYGQQQPGVGACHGCQARSQCPRIAQMLEHIRAQDHVVPGSIEGLVQVEPFDVAHYHLAAPWTCGRRHFGREFHRVNRATHRLLQVLRHVTCRRANLQHPRGNRNALQQSAKRIFVCRIKLSLVVQGDGQGFG